MKQHPGIVLKEMIAPRSATAFAVEIGVTPSRICEIVSGKRGIPAKTAILLGAKLNTSPHYWMELQNEYDIYLELTKK